MASSTPTPLKAPDLIRDPLPNLVVGSESERTTYASTQKTWFAGELVHWDTFESSARKYFANIRWTADPVLSYRPNNQQTITGKERLLCGDEHTVVARYNQHIGHILTAIFQTSLRDPARFGDYKTYSDNPVSGFKKVPDFVVLGQTNSDLLVVGEGKTHWKHPFKQHRDTDPAKFRRDLGQISGYMKKLDAKYGFLTNYNETIFLKQEKGSGSGAQWVLYCSPVIKHDTHWSPMPLWADPKEFQGKQKVTLRECFLYIINLASQQHKAVNAMADNGFEIVDLGRLTGGAQFQGRNLRWASEVTIKYDARRRQWWYRGPRGQSVWIDDRSFGLGLDGNNKLRQYFTENGRYVP